jgi:hypothetical protein
VVTEHPNIHDRLGELRSFDWKESDGPFGAENWSDSSDDAGVLMDLSGGEAAISFFV